MKFFVWTPGCFLKKVFQIKGVKEGYFSILAIRNVVICKIGRYKKGYHGLKYLSES